MRRAKYLFESCVHVASFFIHPLTKPFVDSPAGVPPIRSQKVWKKTQVAKFVI